LKPAFSAVIADHLVRESPTVLEGDYLQPSLLDGDGGHLLDVMLVEPDRQMLQSNSAARTR
jgi:hypothetical protein